MTTHTAGNVTLHHDDADVFVYYFGPGPTTPADLQSIVKAEHAAWTEGVSHIFSITVLDPENAQAPGFFVEAVKLWRRSPARSSAFVLRQFKLRSSMEFFLRSIRWVGVTVDMAFFEDEAAARAWLSSCKKARLGSAKHNA